MMSTLQNFRWIERKSHIKGNILSMNCLCERDLKCNKYKILTIFVDNKNEGQRSSNR